MRRVPFWRFALPVLAPGLAGCHGEHASSTIYVITPEPLSTEGGTMEIHTEATIKIELRGARKPAQPTDPEDGDSNKEQP